MLNYLKYLFLVIILFCIPSSASACSHCINDPILWAFPSVILGLPLYILWLIIFTIFAILHKRSASKVAYTAYPGTYKIVKSWLLLLLLIVMWQIYMLPSLIICIIWVIYLIRQWINWVKVKEQPKEGYLFVKLHRATLIILIILGIGIFIFSRTTAGLLLYFKEGIRSATESFSNDEIVKLLEHKDDKIRSQAIWELDIWRNVDECKKYTPNIAKLLNDKDGGIRSVAIRILTKFKAIEYTGDIAKLLQDEDDSVRWKAVEALNKLDAKEYSSDIAKLINDKDEWVRSTALETLGKWGVKWGENVDDTIKLLSDKDARVRRNTVELLGNSGDKKYAKDIYRLINDEDEFVRVEAAKAFVKLGVRDYHDDIIGLLKDSDQQVCFGTAMALGALGAKEYAGNVVKLLKHNHFYPRGYAVIALGQMGAKEYINDIAKLLDDENSWVQGETIWSLGVLGAKEYALNIAKLLEKWEWSQTDDYPWLREVAAEALGKLKVKETLEPLKRKLEKEKNNEVKIQIKQAIQQIESEKDK